MAQPASPSISTQGKTLGGNAHRRGQTSSVRWPLDGAYRRPTQARTAHPSSPLSKLETTAPRMIARQFLRDLIKASVGKRSPGAFLCPPQPYRLHTILTDRMGFGGVQSCHPPRYRDGPTAKFAGHLFDRICAEHEIEHRLTKPNHPWNEKDQETIRGDCLPDERSGRTDEPNHQGSTVLLFSRQTL